ncbi:MAG: MATE family efflux transporter [Polyangiaceae bacterium]
MVASVEMRSTTTIDFDANRYRTILKLAIPTVLAMLTQSIVNHIDVIFFSRLPSWEGSNAQAALMPSLIIIWLFGGSLGAVSVGAQALTARRFAEGDVKGAGAVLTNAAFFCLVAGFVFSLVGYLTLPFILGFMIKSPPVLKIAIGYSRWRLLGVISMAMTMAVKAFFDGLGRTQVHLVAAIVMNFFNVIFCYAFIFGHLGAPRVGPVGAGLSAFMATWIGLAIMLIYVFKLKPHYQAFQRVHLSKTLTWSILKLSIPAGFATVIMMVGFALFASIVGKLDAGHEGAEAVNGAATTDIVAILNLTFTACIAFGTATATLVSQSLGARRPKDAVKFGWASVRLGIMIFSVVAFLEGVVFTRPLVHFISHQSLQVQEVALIPMHIVGIITPIIAVAMILSEALFGAGVPKFVALAQFVLIFGCLVPLSRLFSIELGLGLNGIFLATSVYVTLAAAAMCWKFAQGSWTSIRL